MANWKATEEQSYRDFLYIEEVNSNDTTSRRISGIATNQSVEDLKKCIATSLGNADGWNSISVAFAGQDLSDHTATLDSQGIQDGDTIFFTRSVTPQVTSTPDNPPPYSGTRTLENVMFKDLDGKTLTLRNIPLNWTVAQLREKLGSDKAIEVEYYRFIYGGKQLNDDNSLETYGLQEGCTIHMVLRLKGGF